MPLSTNDLQYAQAHPESVPLFLTQLDSLGGAERSVLAMAAWLRARGRAAHFVVYEDNCNFVRYAGFPLVIHELRPEGGVRGRVKALQRYFAEHRFTAPPLVSGYQPALHATLARLGRFHCLMHDTPVLFEVEQSRDRSWKQRLRTLVSNRIIGFGLRSGGGETIVTSEFLKADSRKEFGVEAQIARMGGLSSGTGFVRRPFEGELRLLSVCRIEENKRIDWMLEALAELERQGGGVAWRLDLAGRGSLLEAMKLRAQELGLSERVHFHGFVPDDALDELYRRAHLFLMPAVQGYGIPAIEALQRGIPVLLHRESGVSDILLETPWASVLTGGKEEMAPKLGAMMSS
ncbi:MAG: glycosyltransferase, partial [Acidobacteriaceae bacterium]|nr:glycosyltransferase [Acidobacteriaceae bacterium]